MTMKSRKKIKHKRKVKIPNIYLDTNIIRTLIEKRLPILVNLMRTIKDRKWACFTSTIAVLELSNLKKDDVYFRKKINEKAEYKEIIKGRDQKKLEIKELREVNRYIENFFNRYPYFYAYQIPAEVWRDALKISFEANINSIDAVHLATALIFKANVLITSDTHFIKEANSFLEKYKLAQQMKVILAGNIFDTLTELGFELEN